MGDENNDGAGDGAGAGSGGAADILGSDGAAAAAASLGAGGAGEGDAGAGGGDGGGDPDWLAKLSADGGDADNPSNRDYAKAKGFKDLDGVFKSLRETEKAFRAGNKVVLPGADAKPEEIAAFHEAIGVPKDASGYEIKGPDGVKLNDALIGHLSETAAKAGIPKGAFEATVDAFIKFQMDEASTAEAAQKADAQAKVKEWGPKSNEMLAHVDAAARALGFTKKDMTGFRETLGGGRSLELLAKLGAGMAEDILTTGGTGRFGVTPEAAQAEMDRLKTDTEFQKKVGVKGSPEKARWDRLQEAVGAAADRMDRAA